MTIIDISRARFAAAEDASCVTAEEVLREAFARISAGEWAAHSIIIIGIDENENGGTAIQLMHGGPADTNQRLGMILRAQKTSLDGMLQS